MNPHQVTKDFEQALCEYTGAPYAVTTTSCTMALLLAVAWHLKAAAPNEDVPHKWGGPYPSPFPVEIPKRTYVSVPQSIIHAGGRPTYRDEVWRGAYQLKPLPVWDSARYFTGSLYRGIASEVFTSRDNFHETNQVRILRDCAGQMVCVSFHWAKTLGIQQGGAILHDNPEADAWLRMARFDGRQEGVNPKDQKNWILGWHAYMSPEVAALGLMKLSLLGRNHEPLPNDDYPDLSLIEAFR